MVIKNMGTPRRDEFLHTKYAYWHCQHFVIPSQVTHLYILYHIIANYSHFLFLENFVIYFTIYNITLIFET